MVDGRKKSGEPTRLTADGWVLHVEPDATPEATQEIGGGGMSTEPVVPARTLAFVVTLDRKQGSTDDMLEREFGAILADALMAPLGGARHFVGYRIDALARPALPAPPRLTDEQVDDLIALGYEQYHREDDARGRAAARAMFREVLGEVRAALPAEPVDPELIAALALIADYGWVYDGHTTFTINLDTPAEAKRLGAALEAAWRARTAFAMSPEKRARLEAAGWKVGDADEFLGLAAQGIGEGPPQQSSEPSEAAIEAAREASAHTGELGMADHLLSRRTTIEMLRAAYAVDRGRAVEGGSPDPEAIREAMELEFKRIGINHHIEILHRVACAVHDALKRVAASQGAP